MSTNKEFSYFYGMESDQYTFLRVPKILFCDPELKELSCESKLLYGMMLDRMSLSQKNKWFDDQMRAYICFTVEDVVEELGCGRNKAIKSMQELENIGLIERKRLGLGRNSIIYVKKFMPEVSVPEQSQKFKNQTSAEIETDSEVSNINFRKFENQTSRGLRNKLPEVYFQDPNNTNTNNINNDNPLSHHIDREEEKRTGHDTMRPEEECRTETEAYQELISENIGFADLIRCFPEDRESIEGIRDLMLETVLSNTGEILIASSRYPKELVKSRMLKLNGSHVQYALECLKKNTSKVRNIRKYLLAVLFNAPATMDSYYLAESNHDMMQTAMNS